MPRALSDLAQTVPGRGGVTFVPALAGLGAPHWDDSATGTIAGMTHATTPAHLARATFEAIAQQIADVFEAMEADIGQPLDALRADGGASANGFLMQLQADLLSRPVIRSDMEEVGAFGVAAMAFAALGANLSLERDTECFAPSMNPARVKSIRAGWHDAVRRVMA